MWPDTAVTDHALTRVVAQLRKVLGDDVRQARYLETVPTRGYRWIHPVEEADGTGAGGRPAVAAPEVAVRRPFLPGLGAAAGLGLMALLMLAWAQRYAPAEAVDAAVSRAPAGAIAWPVQVTTHGGLDFHPAFSPTGDGVAFVSDRSGALEIYVRGSGGTAVDTPLTSDGRHNVQPAWSPDGRDDRLSLLRPRRHLGDAGARRHVTAGGGDWLAAGVVARWPAARVSVGRACRRVAERLRRASGIDPVDRRCRWRQSPAADP